MNGKPIFFISVKLYGRKEYQHLENSPIYSSWMSRQSEQQRPADHSSENAEIGCHPDEKTRDLSFDELLI